MMIVLTDLALMQSNRIDELGFSSRQGLLLFLFHSDSWSWKKCGNKIVCI